MKIARKEIMRIKPYVPGKPIDEVKRELGLDEAVKLASNENAFPPSPRAIRAAKKALNYLNRYPDGGCFYLKKALAQRLGVAPGNIVTGNGSDEIIILALRAFLKPGEEVIIAKPAFLVYEIAARVHGAKIRFAPLKNFRYDVKKAAALVTEKTRMIFLANPHNPAGTYVTKGEIDFLVRKTPKKTILFFDEAYYEFAGGVRDFPRSLKYIESRNVIVTRSFSKAYSLAGARIGYGVARRAIIDCLNRSREPFNVNSVAQAAALAALEDKKHAVKALEHIEKGKAFIYRGLDSMGLKYIPSVTNFILVNTGKKAGPVYRKLLKRGIIVRDMGAWKLDNFMRVTVGTMRENKKFIKALKQSL